MIFFRHDDKVYGAVELADDSVVVYRITKTGQKRGVSKNVAEVKAAAKRAIIRHREVSNAMELKQ